jgi:hypothetical protein
LATSGYVAMRICTGSSMALHPIVARIANGPGLDPAALIHRFPWLDTWERRESSPTLKQLESFAKATQTPVGYLFLREPPVEPVPIPDFRTAGNERIGHPSSDLLDTVYICRQRQEWYRDFARSQCGEPVPFVGSAILTNDVEATAATIRNALGFGIEERRQMPTWTDALRRFIEPADALGVLVMVNGVVGSSNRRQLDPREFRGFALADNLAPLVFINGAIPKRPKCSHSRMSWLISGWGDPLSPMHRRRVPFRAARVLAALKTARV